MALTSTKPVWDMLQGMAQHDWIWPNTTLDTTGDSTLMSVTYDVALPHGSLSPPLLFNPGAPAVYRGFCLSLLSTGVCPQRQCPLSVSPSPLTSSSG